MISKNDIYFLMDTSDSDYIFNASDKNARKTISEINVFKQYASGYNDISELLADLAIETDLTNFEDGISPLVDETEEKPVVLSTIHSAKGLEWRYVFMPHSLDGLMPSIKNLKSIEEEEEENRLFYVATTRAEDGLYITMPSLISDKGGIYTKPSRFLVKVDDKTYEYKSVAKSKDGLTL